MLRIEDVPMNVTFSRMSIALVMSVVLLAVTSCATGPTAPTAPDTDTAAVQPAPEEVVQEFYDWYLDYIGDRSSGEFRNPLVDGAYQDAPNMADEFVAEVDTLLAEQREQQAGGYDPFLCAQDIPTTIDVGSAQITADTAVVPVTTDFADHGFTVELTRVDDTWEIRNVVCAVAD